MQNTEMVNVDLKLKDKTNINLFLNLLLILCLIIGVGIGTLFIYYPNNYINQDLLNSLVKHLIENRKSIDFSSVLFSSFISTTCYVFLAFTFGCSPISQPIIGILPLVKGIGLGITISYLYLEYKVIGMIYVAMSIIPVCILSVLAIILSSREAIKFGCNIYSIIQKKSSVVINLRIYVLKFLVILIIVLLSSLLDSTMNVLFFNFFKLD